MSHSLEPGHDGLVHVPQRLHRPLGRNPRGLSRLRRPDARELEPRLVLDVGHALLVLATHQGDADSGAAGAARAAGAVDVGLGVFRGLDLRGIEGRSREAEL